MEDSEDHHVAKSHPDTNSADRATPKALTGITGQKVVRYRINNVTLLVQARFRLSLGGSSIEGEGGKFCGL